MAENEDGLDVTVTWFDVARTWPDHAQAYVQKVGPLPEGVVQQADWDRFCVFARGRDS